VTETSVDIVESASSTRRCNTIWAARCT